MKTILNNLKLKSLELADSIKSQVAVINKLQESVDTLADIKAHIDIAISDMEGKYVEMEKTHTLDSEVTQVIEQLFRLTGTSSGNINNSTNNTKETLAKEFDAALAADKADNDTETPSKVEISADNTTSNTDASDASNSEMSKEDITDLIDQIASDIEIVEMPEESTTVDADASINSDTNDADDLDFDISDNETSENSTNTDVNSDAPTNDIVSNLAALGL